MTWNSQKIIALTLLQFLLLSTVTDVFAEEFKFRPENFTHLTIEDGLPQNNVRCIDEDQYGFLWLCTSDGLVRYDGYDFELVTEGTDGSRISNTTLRTIFVEGDVLWIGTERGLNRFNLKKGVFEQINLNVEGQSKKHIIRSLLKVKDGEIWVGTKSGIYIVNYTNNKINSVQNIEPTIIARDMLLINGSVYVANYGKNIVEIDLVSRKIIHSLTFPSLHSNNILNINFIENKLYLATYGDGLIITDLELNIIKHYKSCKNLEADCLAGGNVYFTVKFNNEIWVGSDNGINIIDNPSLMIKSFVQLTSLIKNKYISDSLNNVHISKNNLWFGLNPGGLVNYKLNIEGINKYYIQHDLKFSTPINDTSIYSVASNGINTYAGTYAGLYRIDKIENNIKPVITVNSQLRDFGKYISFLCFIDTNNLLLGTIDGLLRYDVVRDKLKKIVITNKSNDVDIRGISCDDRTLITTKKGYMYQHIKDDTYRLLNSENISKFVVSIYADDKKIYLATNRGLIIYNLNGKDIHEEKTIMEDSFIIVAASTEKQILLGTLGGGLFIWSKEQEQLSRVNLDYQTMGNTIYDIEIIGNQAWLSTNNGIIKLDLYTLQYKHYVQSHGLSDKEFTLGSFFYDQEINTLYAGGVTGLTSIEMDDFNSIKWETENIVSKISIVNSEGVISDNYYNQPEQIDMNEGDTLLVQLGRKNAAIRYSSNFTYSVKKFSNTSRAILRPSQRDISLVDIPSSDFTLTIGDGQQYSLEVSVTPYIWKRWWSYVLYLLIILFLIRTFISQYQSIQETKNREIISSKELDLKRKQLASLSHELRTPLNAIVGITDATNLVNSDITHIKSSAYLLRSLIDNALDSVSLDVSNSISITKTTFSVEELIEKVINILSIYLSSRNIIIVTNIERDVPKLIVSDEIRIQQIVLNLIKNAIKHSKVATKIKVNVSMQANNLSISVADDGIGISYLEQQAIFDVFYKVESKKSGFGLGLYISKLISHALGGDLILDSEPNKGSIFTLTIPVKTEQSMPKSHDTQKKIESTKIRRLLVLEDDPLNIYALKLQLEKIGLVNFTIVDTYDAYVLENKSDYDCVILDLNFGHQSLNGIDLAKELNENNYQGSVYILTAESDASIKEDARGHVVDYLVKPILIRDLEEILVIRD